MPAAEADDAVRELGDLRDMAAALAVNSVAAYGAPVPSQRPRASDAAITTAGIGSAERLKPLRSNQDSYQARPTQANVASSKKHPQFWYPTVLSGDATIARRPMATVKTHAGLGNHRIHTSRPQTKIVQKRRPDKAAGNLREQVLKRAAVISQHGAASQRPRDRFAKNAGFVGAAVRTVRLHNAAELITHSGPRAAEPPDDLQKRASGTVLPLNAETEKVAPSPRREDTLGIQGSNLEQTSAVPASERILEAPTAKANLGAADDRDPFVESQRILVEEQAHSEPSRTEELLYTPQQTTKIKVATVGDSVASMAPRASAAEAAIKTSMTAVTVDLADPIEMKDARSDGPAMSAATRQRHQHSVGEGGVMDATCMQNQPQPLHIHVRSLAEKSRRLGVSELPFSEERTGGANSKLIGSRITLSGTPKTVTLRTLNADGTAGVSKVGTVALHQPRPELEPSDPRIETQSTTLPQRKHATIQVVDPLKRKEHLPAQRQSYQDGVYDQGRHRSTSDRFRRYDALNHIVGPDAQSISEVQTGQRSEHVVVVSGHQALERTLRPGYNGAVAQAPKPSYEGAAYTKRGELSLQSRPQNPDVAPDVTSEGWSDLVNYNLKREQEPGGPGTGLVADVVPAGMPWMETELSDRGSNFSDTLELSDVVAGINAARRHGRFHSD